MRFVKHASIRGQVALTASKGEQDLYRSIVKRINGPSRRPSIFFDVPGFLSIGLGEKCSAFGNQINIISEK
jgi:hypothetical protein